jgi:hypothetical protein
MSNQIRFELKEMSVSELAKAISEDVESGKDIYREITAHDLPKVDGRHLPSALPLSII